MREFFYQALAQDQQICTGQISAANAAAALESLESQGYSVLLIRRVDAVSAAVSIGPGAPKRQTNYAGEQILTERVAEMLEQRATLAPALAAFSAEMPAGRAQRDLRELAEQIQTGATAETLSQKPRFASTWLPLIGDRSTVGATHLQDVLAESERENANRMQIKRVFAYPVIVITLALLVLILLAVLVVPTFEDIFDDFNIDLPKMTVAIVNFSRMLRFHPLAFIGLLLGVIAAIYFGLKILREWILPGRLFGVFLNGNSQQVAEMAVFVRRLTEAINAGMPLADALQLVGRDSRHRWLQREASVLADAIAAHPSNTTNCLKKSALPATVAYALQAGPEGAPHVALLQALAESYSARVGDRFSLATGFLPQLAILAVGIAVGIVVLALFLPLVTLVNGLIW